MTTSYNGWPASPDPRDLNVAPLVVEGVPFVGGVRSGDVHTVLEYVATQYHHRVEALISPGCWGWAYRQNRNASNLSCHSSATAIDVNAPKHPNGIEASRTFTASEIAEVHQILAEIPELAEVVHWGGDWHREDRLTPDPMHFEIHNYDRAKLARVAMRVREANVSKSPGLVFQAAILTACRRALLDIPTRRRVQRAAVVAIRTLARRFPTP